MRKAFVDHPASLMHDKQEFQGPQRSFEKQKLIKSALHYQIQNMLADKYSRSCPKSKKKSVNFYPHICMVNTKRLLLF